MANQGDDCYFFYYSSCAKGALCPFRHCEAALGNETVCSLWREGRCFRQVCQFRHMESNKNRNIIACYWESQPGGCLKPHCPFRHLKPRNIDGQMPPLPPIYGLQDKVETPQPSASLTVPTTATPSFTQYTGAGDSSNILQGHGSEVMIPSPPISAPTIAPVIVKPEDSEDDNEESSHDGSPVRRRLGSPLKPVRIIPTRKETTASSVQAPAFGIKTLAEIRHKKTSVQPAMSSSSSSSATTMPRPVTSSSILSRRFAQMADDTEPASVVAPPPPTRRIITSAQQDDPHQEAMSGVEGIQHVGDVRRATVLQRLGQPGLQQGGRLATRRQVPTTSGDEHGGREESSGLQGVQVRSLADIRREKLMQRLGRTQSPTPDEDEDDVEEESGNLENVQVKTLADVRRKKLMNRLGRPGSPVSEEARNVEGESGNLQNVRVKTLADVRRKTLLNRLGRPHSPATEEDMNEDEEEEEEEESGNLQDVQVKSLADIKREKLMQRLGNRSLKRKTEDSSTLGVKSLQEIKRWKTEDSSTRGVKSAQEIKRGKMMQRLGDRTEDDIKEDDGDFDPDKIQVKSLKEIRRGKLMQRLGKPSESTTEDAIVMRQGQELLKKFVGLAGQQQRGAGLRVKSLAQIRAEKAANIDVDEEDQEEDEEDTSIPKGTSKVAVKILADVRAERTSKLGGTRIKSLAEIRAEKAGRQGPRSIAVKSLAEIRAEKAAVATKEEKEGEDEDDVESRSLPSSRLGRKRQERAIYRPPSSSSQGVTKPDIKARLGGRTERQPSRDDDTIKKDAGSPRKESLATRLQRKTITFLPKQEEPTGDKIAVKSLLEMRREKRLQQKLEEKSDAPSGLVVKSLADMKSGKKSVEDEDKSEDADRTFDPSKIKVKSLADIRRERRLQQEQEQSHDNGATSESSSAGVKSLADIRREKRLRLGGGKTSDTDRTSGPSGIAVKSLVDIRRERRLRQGDEDVRQEAGSSDGIQIKSLAEIRGGNSDKIQAPVAEAKKLPSTGQQGKKLTDAERRERRAKIWKRELKPENEPPPTLSGARTGEIGTKVAVKRPADSALRGLKVKTLDEIRKAKQKAEAGGEREEERPKTEETTVPVKLARPTPSSPSALHGLPLRRKIKVPSVKEELPLSASRQQTSTPSSTAIGQAAINTEPDSSSSYSTVTTHSIIQTSATADVTSPTSLPASDMPATTKVSVTTLSPSAAAAEVSATTLSAAAEVSAPFFSAAAAEVTSPSLSAAAATSLSAAAAAEVSATSISAAATPSVSSSLDIQSSEIQAQESFPVQQDVIAPVVERQPSIPDVKPQQQSPVSKSQPEDSDAKRPRTERLTSISDDLDDLLEDMGDNKDDDEEELGDDDILLELDELINS